MGREIESGKGLGWYNKINILKSNFRANNFISQISAKNGVFLKYQSYDSNLAKTGSIMYKKRHFRQFFGRKYF
jgi:hypothetical protein